MIVEVKMFAVARQLAGSETCRVEVGGEHTVADLRDALVEAVPALASLASQIRFAVNAEYAGDSSVIPDGAEVALIPPVSGG